jgi:Tfp pilus assembly protein PilO
MKLGNLNINKGVIVKIAIVVITLLVVNAIYGSQGAMIKSLEEKKEIELKKNQVITEISQSGKMLNSYKEFLNKKDASSIINTIGNIAKESGLKITSIKPNPQKKYPFYIKYSLDLSLGVDNYHTLGKFIRNLERYPDVYFIDKITIRSVTVNRAAQEIDTLKVDLTLSTIVL